MKSILWLIIPLLLISCYKDPINRLSSLDELNINASSTVAENSLYVQINAINNQYLQLSNGNTFIPIGLNIPFIRYEDKESEILGIYERYFQELSKNGGNLVRIWLGAPAFEVEHEKAGVYDLSIAQRMDKIVDLAEKYNIRIKFCLEHFRDLTGYPAPFKGSIPFDRPIYSIANGGKIKDMKSYITTKEGKDLYLNRVEFWAKRYSERPIIFGWELWNEMEVIEVTDKYLIETWMAEIFPKVKKLVPNQLVMQSMASFDNASERYYYSNYTKIKDNSIAQVHRYLDQGAAFKECKGPMDEVASDAINILNSYNLNKPIILSEGGAVEPKHAGPSKLYEKDTQGILFHDFLFAPFFSGAAATGQIWHWDYYIEKNNLWYHFKRFSTAIKGFDPVREKAKTSFKTMDNMLKVYGLYGENTDLIWLRDGENNWETELVENKQPRVIKQQKFVLVSNVVSATIYNPWEDTWIKAIIKDNSIILPDFSRSIIVKLDKSL